MFTWWVIASFDDSRHPIDLEAVTTLRRQKPHQTALTLEDL
jgi:hypothetical protein